MPIKFRTSTPAGPQSDAPVPRLPICDPLLDSYGDFDPMNLVNPYAFSGTGSTDPDAQAYFDEIANVGSTIDATARAAINDFVVGCKADSIWSLLLDIGPLCGDDLTAALVKLKKLSSSWSYGNSGFAGGAYAQSTGLTGDGTHHLTTGVAGTDLTNNSTGLGVYCRSSANGTSNVHGARSVANAATERVVLFAASDDNIPYVDLYDSANELGGSSISGPVGFILGTRPSSSELSLYRNESLVGTTSSVGGSLPSDELWFFDRNAGGSGAGASSLSHAFLCITLGMDATQAAAFNTRVQALQTALGRNV
jgi:hypothetical protein